MFEYTFNHCEGDFKILTPFANSMNDIKQEITQTSNCIRKKSTFPNGVVLDMEQYHDTVIVRCSNELVNNNDGTYSIVL